MKNKALILQIVMYGFNFSYSIYCCRCHRTERHR